MTKTDWTKAARRRLAGLCAANPSTNEITPDVLRTGVSKQVGDPPHPNSWGGLFKWGSNQGMLRPTGQYRPSRLKTANRRMVPVYTTQANIAHAYIQSA